jgi:hypothetical protein
MELVSYKPKDAHMVKNVMKRLHTHVQFQNTKCYRPTSDNRNFVLYMYVYDSEFVWNTTLCHRTLFQTIQNMYGTQKVPSVNVP